MRSFVWQKALPGLQPRRFFVGDAFQNLSAVHTKGIQHTVYHLFGLRGKRQSALLQRHKGGIKQRFVVNRCIVALNIIQQLLQGQQTTAQAMQTMTQTLQANALGLGIQQQPTADAATVTARIIDPTYGTEVK